MELFNHFTRPEVSPRYRQENAFDGRMVVEQSINVKFIYILYKFCETYSANRFT